MAKTTERLKLRELVKRTGVGRGTIQHYLREGLLPQPVKTSPNVAYYDPACVDRIKLIKELQTKRHLPLAAIRTFLASIRSDGALAKTLTDAQQSALETLKPPTIRALSLDAAAKAFELRRGLLDDLCRLEIISTIEADGEEVLADSDLEVLAAIANLDRKGLSEKNGFRPEDLLLYREKLEELLDDELRMFVQMMSRPREDDAPPIPTVAAGAVEGATMLVVALRRKLIGDRLRSADPWRLAGVAGTDTDTDTEPARTTTASPTGASPDNDEPPGGAPEDGAPED